MSVSLPHRDLRPPEVITDRNGRKVLIDQAVLQLLRGTVPPDEPAPTGLRIHSLQPFRVSFTTRPQCGPRP